MKANQRSEGVTALLEERKRLRNHNERLMDELKEARRQLRRLEADHAALLDATKEDGRTRLALQLSELLTRTEDKT